MKKSTGISNENPYVYWPWPTSGKIDNDRLFPHELMGNEGNEKNVILTNF